MVGIKVEKPDDVHGAWGQALTADRPCLVEFVTDPAIPPHVTWDQMVKTAKALLHDPEAGDVIRAGVKSKAQEVLPGGRDRR